MHEGYVQKKCYKEAPPPLTVDDHLVLLGPDIDARRVVDPNHAQCLRPANHKQNEGHADHENNVAENVVELRWRVGGSLDPQVGEFLLQDCSILLKHLPVPSRVAASDLKLDKLLVPCAGQMLQLIACKQSERHRYNLQDQ